MTLIYSISYTKKSSIGKWQYNNIEGIPRNACGTSGDISIRYLICMIAKLQRVKEKHMSPYVEYGSPVCYCRQVMCRVKVFFFKSRSKVTVKVTWSKLVVPPERSRHKEHTCSIESPMSNGREIMCRVNVFKIKVKGHVQGHVIKI